MEDFKPAIFLWKAEFALQIAVARQPPDRASGGYSSIGVWRNALLLMANNVRQGHVSNSIGLLLDKRAGKAVDRLNCRRWKEITHLGFLHVLSKLKLDRPARARTDGNSAKRKPPKSR